MALSKLAVMQLRVLCGPQAGCWLPLGSGTYSAGGDEYCDIVLEGMPTDQIAFAVYVGHQTIALEALTNGVRLDGRLARGLCELRPGAVFELGQWLFTVDDAEAPWPENPESLRPIAKAEVAREVEEAQDPAAAAPPEAVPGEIVSETATPALAVEPALAPSEAQSAQAPPAVSETPVRARRKLPFWVVWLAGTAAFLGLGVLALVVSLAPPPKAAAKPDVARVALSLESVVAAAPHDSDVKLDHQAGGRPRLFGRVATRRQKVDLVRQARAVEPWVLIQVVADEDLEALARETLARFPNSGVEFARMQLGHLTLKGHIASGTLRDQIVAAMWDSVPGLSAVDSQILINDESLTALHELLAHANLTGRIAGHLDGNRLIVDGTPDAADRKAWLTVRSELVSRFGEPLQIEESFNNAPADGASPPPASPGRPPQRGDVVAVVMGPMPYMLLRNGTKLAMPAVVEGP